MPIDAAKADRLGVFISYSRRDTLDFADQLAKSLGMLGYRTIFDREGISGGELWHVRLGQMLLECDTVVFVMSPECAWEVEEAARLAKRILPVIAMPLGSAKPPERLQQLNFIHFYAEKSVPGSGFGDGLVRLNVALKSDLDWLREHTRLLERATEWEKGQRTPNRMLSGTDIGAAKTWAARRPKDAPEPTALQLDYIKASEAYEADQQDERQRQLEERERLVNQAEADRTAREAAQRRVVRRTRTGLAVALVLAAIATAAGLLAFRQQREAAFERDRARSALAQVLAERSWNSTQNGNSDLAIRYALAGWRVAPANAAHYRAPLAQAMASPIVATERQLHQGSITTLISSPDGRYAVSGGEDGIAVLLDMKSLQIIHSLQSASGGIEPVTAAAIDPSGRKLITLNTDGTVRLWDMKSGSQISELLGHTDRIDAAVFSPDAQLLATASSDKTARLWDVEKGIQLAVMMGHTDGVSTLAFSPDGTKLVTGGRDGTAILWDAATGQLLRDLRGHTGGVTAIVFSPDGRFLFTGSDDKMVLVWDVIAEMVPPKKLIGHVSGIQAITLSLDGLKLYVVDFNGNTYIWDIRTSRIVVASTSGAEEHGLASFGFGGLYAAITGKGGTLRIWDAEAARSLMSLRDEKSPRVSAILWSEQRLFVGDSSGMLSIYDLKELTQSISELAARACTKDRALSPRFEWIEAAIDPLIKEIWDPDGNTRSVCE